MSPNTLLLVCLVLTLSFSGCGSCASSPIAGSDLGNNRGDGGGSEEDAGESDGPDSDGDGLSDGEEAELGTDPDNPDSDGDGVLDGNEVTVGTDPTTPDEACGVEEYTASTQDKPVDIIFVIDNSFSMDDELVAVEDNINDSFAQIIEQSGIDYRVVMISSHAAPEDNHICIKEPLSGTDCDPVPDAPVNGPRFFHYDVGIDSEDAFRKFLQAWDTEDMHGFAPDGVQQWLRADAFKVIIAITDDQSGDELPGGEDPTAANFDQALLQLEPDHFGRPGVRNYVFHSIVGLASNNPDDEPWLPADSLLANTCPSGVEPGLEYQKLSVVTGGLRYPVCNFDTYDAVFEAAAQGIIERARLECDIAVPDVGEGQSYDADALIVQFAPDEGEPTRTFRRTSKEECADDDEFYLTGSTITLCPQVCEDVKAAENGELLVVAACSVPPETCTPTDDLERNCEDGIDNDCDGFVDRQDVECLL
jgi:hypothetical protein